MLGLVVLSVAALVAALLLIRARPDWVDRRSSPCLSGWSLIARTSVPIRLPVHGMAATTLGRIWWLLLLYFMIAWTA